MNKLFGSVFAALLGLVLLAAACTKYPNGANFSTRSAADRLANLWVLEEYLENGQNRSDSFSMQYKDMVWRFGKDNSFDFYGQYKGNPWSRSGDWSFTNSKKSINLVNQASDSTYTYEILQLREKVLWLAQTDTSGIQKEWHLIEKTE